MGMSESCHIWMSHVTYGRVMSHIHESCHACMHMNLSDESCHIWMSHDTCKFHNHSNSERLVTRMSASCHTYEWAMSHIWMSHVKNMNWSCHVYEWVMSHMNELFDTWTSPVTYMWFMSHMHESCHIYMSHVTYKWVMSRIHESFHIYTHSYVWHDSFIRVS